MVEYSGGDEEDDEAGEGEQAFPGAGKHRTENVGRQYLHEKEQELWDRFRYLSLDPARSEYVEVVRLGSQLGIHPEKTRDIIRTWDNSNLAFPMSQNNLNNARLSERGRYTIDPRDPRDPD